MIKAILFALLVLSTIQQDQNLASSDDNSAVASDSGIVTGSSQFGSPPPTTTERMVLKSSTSGSSTASTATIAAAYASSQAPSFSNWIFLKQNSLGGSATWRFPDSTKQMFARNYLKTYTITFYTNCPQGGVNLRIGGTGVLFMSLNGQSILNWGSSWPTVHSIPLTKPSLVCGCNKLIVQVYNYYFESPGAIIYTLKQNPCNYTCSNLGVTYYNKETCSCDCAHTYPCSYLNMATLWYGYPACGCRCSQLSGPCLQNQFWDLKTCSCQCQKVCCSTGYVQSPLNCACVPIQIAPNPYSYSYQTGYSTMAVATSATSASLSKSAASDGSDGSGGGVNLESQLFGGGR